MSPQIPDCADSIQGYDCAVLRTPESEGESGQIVLGRIADGSEQGIVVGHAGTPPGAVTLPCGEGRARRHPTAGKRLRLEEGANAKRQALCHPLGKGESSEGALPWATREHGLPFRVRSLQRFLPFSPTPFLSPLACLAPA